MSQFLPEGTNRQDKRNEQQEQLPAEFLTQKEREVLQRQLGFPEDLPKPFKSWLVEYISVHPPDIPVTSLRGFTGFRPRVAEQADTGASGNSAYTDLGGPELTQLEAGQYLFLFGFNSSDPSDPGDPGVGFAAPSINGVTPNSDSDAAVSEGSAQSAMYYAIKNLTEGSNSVKLLYRMQGGTGTRDYNRPFLIGFKIG